MRLIEPLGIRHVAYRLAGTLADTPIALSPPPPRELTPPEGAAPLVVLHVGASTAFKRWPADRFAALAVRLHRRHGDRIVLIGNRHDQPIAAQVAARVGDAAPLVDAAGNLALAETAALIKQARLFVGSDSGVAHLAIALGVRTVILFGPSDHLKWGAEDARHAVVRRAMPCAPCFIFGYHKPCRSLACMTSIAVDEVARACETVAGEDRASTACRTAAPGADAAAPATPG